MMMMMKGQLEDHHRQVGVSLSTASSAASSFLEECIGCESCLDLNFHTEDHLLELFPTPITAAVAHCDDVNITHEDTKDAEAAVLEEEEDNDDNSSSDRETATKKEKEQEEKMKMKMLKKKKKKKKKEYPPPIPLLARTGNLASHMPWVLKRHYTSDGRLVLTEEKAWRHHEYFRAHRSNGRLTLQLVPLEFDDDDEHHLMISASAADDDDEDGCDGGHQEKDEINNIDDGIGNFSIGDDDDDSVEVVESGEGEDGGRKDEEEEGGFQGIGNAVKCLNYNSGVMVRGSPAANCMLYGSVPVVPTLRPVLG